MRLIALLAAGLVAGEVVSAPVPKSKVKGGLVGKWQLEVYDDGTPKAQQRKAASPVKMAMTFTSDGKMVLDDSSGESTVFGYALDSATEPKVIHLTEGEAALRMKLVYEIDGDTLTMWGESGKSRLMELKPGDGVPVYTLKRVKEEQKKDK